VNRAANSNSFSMKASISALRYTNSSSTYESGQAWSATVRSETVETSLLHFLSSFEMVWFLMRCEYLPFLPQLGFNPRSGLSVRRWQPKTWTFLMNEKILPFSLNPRNWFAVLDWTGSVGRNFVSVLKMSLPYGLRLDTPRWLSAGLLRVTQLRYWLCGSIWFIC
jgi:hypothetical protein